MHSKAKDTISRENGAAMVTAVFSLLLITLLATSLYLLAESTRTSSVNYGQTKEAFFIAEAGLNHAIGLFAANDASFDVNTVIPATGAGTVFGSGSYVVTATPGAQPNTVLITSTGRGPNNASATVESLIQLGPDPNNDVAVAINGDMTVGGNFLILGSRGVIHANGDLVLSGNNRSEEHYSASGTITAPAPQPCPNGSVTGTPPGCDAAADLRQGQPPIALPDMRPTDVFAQADFIFRPPSPPTYATATITDGAGNVLASNCEAGCWGGWTYNSSQGWVANAGSNMPSGDYYAYQSSMQINRTFGADGSPLDISFAADGSISFSGGASYMNPSATLGTRKIAVIAGADIAIQGANLNTSNTVGTFYARHQFYLGGGQPIIQGNIFVYNEADVATWGDNVTLRSGTVSMTVSGDPQVIFNGNDTGGGAANALVIKSWREIRN